MGFLQNRVQTRVFQVFDIRFTTAVAHANMHWYCLRCGRKNEKDTKNCTKCGLDEENALVYPVSRRRRTCEDCSHIHREGVFCHAYTEAAEEDLIDDVESEESNSDDEDDTTNQLNSDDDSDSAPKKKPGAKAKASSIKPLPIGKAKPIKRKPLITPDYAKEAHFVRCNCDVGVPNDCILYEPIPSILVIHGITMQMYMEIVDPEERRRFLDNHRFRTTEEYRLRMRNEKFQTIAQCLPLIMSYLPYGQLAPIPQVCRLWNNGANQFKEYVDIRGCVPYFLFRPHSGQVDSLLVHHDKVYSGGDHRIFVSNLYSGELLSTVTRDSGDVVKLFIHENELYCCSTNGSIRTYTTTHNGQNMQMITTLWEHTRTVIDLMPSLPSHGPCDLHGIDNHMCFMYSSSEDRAIRMWNVQKNKCEKHITSNALRTGSFTRLAQSDRHIFVGSSAGVIAVFNKSNHCDRDDVHACSIPNADKFYCLQVSLKLPANLTKSGNVPVVTGLICPKFGPEFPSLWASDSSGQLTVWYVPKEGLDFTPAYTVRAHQGAINQMENTWRHVITIGDDGCLLLFDVISFMRIRTVNIMEWSIYNQLLINPHIHRRLKCIGVYENYDTGGHIAVGTSYGEVILLPLGTTV